jgi:hypothetical protein
MRTNTNALSSIRTHVLRVQAIKAYASDHKDTGNGYPVIKRVAASMQMASTGMLRHIIALVRVLAAKHR